MYENFFFYFFSDGCLYGSALIIFYRNYVTIFLLDSLSHAVNASGKAKFAFMVWWAIVKPLACNSPSTLNEFFWASGIIPTSKYCAILTHSPGFIDGLVFGRTI